MKEGEKWSKNDPPRNFTVTSRTRTGECKANLLENYVPLIYLMERTYKRSHMVAAWIQSFLVDMLSFPKVCKFAIECINGEKKHKWEAKMKRLHPAPYEIVPLVEIDSLAGNSVQYQYGPDPLELDYNDIPELAALGEALLFRFPSKQDHGIFSTPMDPRGLVQFEKQYLAVLPHLFAFKNFPSQGGNAVEKLWPTEDASSTVEQEPNLPHFYLTPDLRQERVQWSREDGVVPASPKLKPLPESLHRWNR